MRRCVDMFKFAGFKVVPVFVRPLQGSFGERGAPGPDGPTGPLGGLGDNSPAGLTGSKGLKPFGGARNTICFFAVKIAFRIKVDCANMSNCFLKLYFFW